jgi:uncharacterized protein DUF3883
VQDLLSQDWLQRFGADAYLLLHRTSSGTPDQFAKNIAAHLQEADCWPTLDLDSSKALAKASNIALPDSATLAGFLSPNRYLDRRLAQNRDALKFALDNGAVPFTLNSLVRLRCAGQDPSRLSTKLGKREANYHFPGYTAALADEKRQQEMARAITILFRNLSNQNRKDLKETASTLAADGNLCPAEKLVRVDRGLWDMCPEPLSSRLHPSLLDHKGIASLCRPFAIDRWIIDACERAAAGTIQDSEKQALYRHLLSEGVKLGRKALTAVRRSPVVLDHRGNWVAPDDLAQLPAPQAALLSAIVSAPAPALAERIDFVRQLRIRRKLTADDFLRFAPTIGGDSAVAKKFEELMNKNRHLLTPKTVESLRSIPLLHTRMGALLEPERLHLSTVANLACLEGDDTVVGGRNDALYRHLGCRDYPSSETMLRVLGCLKESRTPATRADILYPTLVRALNAEKVPATTYKERPILWVDGAYCTPKDTLIGRGIPRILGSVLPIFNGPESIARAYLELGASSYPGDHHWVRFFQFFATRDDSCVRSRAERRMLQDAYKRCGQAGLPTGLDDGAKCLLARDGSLHSLHELRAGSFVEDDYPQLAIALTERGSPLAFADIFEGSRSFFLTLQLSLLTDVCGIGHIETGTTRGAPGWFRPAHLTNILSIIQQEDFAIAVQALAWAHQRKVSGFHAPSSTDLKKRFSGIHRLQFVSSVARVYHVAGIRASVPAEAASSGDTISLLPARNMVELEQMLAFSLAELIGATRLADIRALTLSILPLLRCRTRGEMFSYLARQGSIPPEWSGMEPSFPDVEPEPEIDDPAEDILRQIVTTLNTGPSSGPYNSAGDGPTPAEPRVPAADAVRQRLVLPPIAKVQVNVAAVASPVVTHPASGVGYGGGGSSTWTPRSFADQERDRMIGDRGEELVYQLELARLRATGHPDPEKHVIWTSRSNPGADHDIVSVAADGKPFWIEVKSTMGTDGRFDWPRAEFEKALREGDHYELWRVYQAHTDAPTVKAFRNPALLLRTSRLRLELGSLRALVEGKDEGSSKE